MLLCESVTFPTACHNFFHYLHYHHHYLHLFSFQLCYITSCSAATAVIPHWINNVAACLSIKCWWKKKGLEKKTPSCISICNTNSRKLSGEDVFGTHLRVAFKMQSSKIKRRFIISTEIDWQVLKWWSSSGSLVSALAKQSKNCANRASLCNLMESTNLYLVTLNDHPMPTSIMTLFRWTSCSGHTRSNITAGNVNPQESDLSSHTLSIWAES